ncbi:KUP/HAK/KT family potassium transporter, partial [Acinetobacter baumannii]
MTPAISVLSAMEGLEVATPGLEHFVVPLTLIVLIFLYAIQSRGTSGIGKLFGPAMMIWFLALAVMGVINILKAPQILQAINP